MIDVSVDIETLSLKPNAVVLSVGMTSTMASSAYSRSLDLHSQLEKSRHVGGDEVAWHLQEHMDMFIRDLQDCNKHFAVKKFFAEFQQHFDNTVGHNEFEVWMRDPDFDHVILQSLADDFGCQLPWTFRQTRSVRTIISLARQKMDSYEIGLPAYPDNAHDALVDATYQLEIVNRCKHILIDNGV